MANALCLLALLPAQAVLTRAVHDTIRAQLKNLIPQDNCSQYFEGDCPRSDFIGGVVRLSFHDAGNYNKTNGSGGSDGCLGNVPAHGGLAEVISWIEPVYQQHRMDISRADFWVLTANFAVEEAGGPSIPMRWGRRDCPDPAQARDEGLLPDATLGWDHVWSVFGQRMGLTAKEIVALLGAHALGRCQTRNSGFDGPWDPTPHKLGNQFYSFLLSQRWDKTVNNVSQNPEWKSENFLMLPTDMSLVIDTSTCSSYQEGEESCTKNPTTFQYVKDYSNKLSDFHKDFAAAYQKLQELGWEGKLCDIGVDCNATPPTDAPSLASKAGFWLFGVGALVAGSVAGFVLGKRNGQGGNVQEALLGAARN